MKINAREAFWLSKKNRINLDKKFEQDLCQTVNVSIENAVNDGLFQCTARIPHDCTEAVVNKVIEDLRNSGFKTERSTANGGLIRNIEIYWHEEEYANGNK